MNWALDKLRFIRGSGSEPVQKLLIGQVHAAELRTELVHEPLPKSPKASPVGWFSGSKTRFGGSSRFADGSSKCRMFDPPPEGGCVEGSTTSDIGGIRIAVRFGNFRIQAKKNPHRSMRVRIRLIQLLLCRSLFDALERLGNS
ncbi:hypothetical protein [Coleofasciculus sp. FACHB-129]|uniref:hypothetical protein n=1 Tax=Cyanophyceae TaxID=3028117 RepID=UPI001686E559|nr:hypothetical protein [Coleofasciculus sp. FACHB-129]MBD1895897.1 hypothetical protein [Coleofasciculus sp. FACHB-129]